MVILDNYTEVLNEFRKNNSNQPVALFAVLKMDELVDKWSILLSANWINDNNEKEVFSDLLAILQDKLSPEELSEIARIGFFPRNEHLVDLMMKQFKQGEHIAEDAKVNGNIVHEGYIVALDDTDASQSSLKI
jgi:hypothetical protein